MTHRDLCIVAANWLLKQQNIDCISVELGINRSVFDVIGITSKPRTTDKKVCIIEVKRTRADLLQDLHAKKMLKYGAKGSHCYLAATEEAYGTKNNKEIVEFLTSKGLPKTWGILLFTNNGIICLRKSTRLRPVTEITIRSILRKIARSYMYRSIINGKPSW